jgi:hypothetical protein
MRKLSTGHDATLGSYRELAALVFGSESPAVAYLDEKIRQESPGAEVIAPEEQVIAALAAMDKAGRRHAA